MKCSNPACDSERFNVTVQHKSLDRDHPDRMPVKLTCAKCKKPVKAWITNEQMKEMLNKFYALVRAYDSLVRVFAHLEKKSEKPWWKFW